MGHILGGGFIFFLVSSLFGEMIQIVWLEICKFGWEMETGKCERVCILLLLYLLYFSGLLNTILHG